MKKSKSAIGMSVLAFTLCASISTAFGRGGWVGGNYQGWGHWSGDESVDEDDAIGSTLGAASVGSTFGAAIAPLYKENASMERIQLELDHYQAGQGASLFLIQEMDDFKDYLISADYPHAKNLTFDDLIKVYSEQADEYEKSQNEIN